MAALIDVLVLAGFVTSLSTYLVIDHWHWARLRREIDARIERAAVELELRILRALHEETEKIDRLAKMRRALGKDN